MMLTRDQCGDNVGDALDGFVTCWVLGEGSVEMTPGEQETLTCGTLRKILLAYTEWLYDSALLRDDRERRNHDT